MLSKKSKLVVLGGSGFIGQHVIIEAIKLGWKVKTLVRSEDSARIVSALGASAFIGEAERPDKWIHEVEDAHALFDLIQPKLPNRVGRRQVLAISEKRQTFTRALVSALHTLTHDERPLLISVSGIDDLSPDEHGYISADSPLRTGDRGFSPVGIPVRKVIEQSALSAAFVYLGTVYGPGKAFAATIFPRLAAGKWKNFDQGSDRMVLIHVEDAARGLVRVAESEAPQILARSFVLTDCCPVEMNSFFELAASLMGVPVPGRIPRWLAAMVAGRSLVETTTCNVPIKSSPLNFPDYQLKYPSFREGLPPTLKALGYTGTP